MSNYNPNSSDSILEKALELLNKSLNDLYPDIQISYKGKGSLGQLVEKIHFGYEPNSNKLADFDTAGVELKASPVKRNKNGTYSAKERLSLTHIDYSTIITESNFHESTLYNKISIILLMFYLYEKDMPVAELIFKIIKLWSIPENDFKIIEQDWLKIIEKVKKGEAHLISGSDTFYLEASTTGQGNGLDLVNQPNSNIKAKRRRFAFKPRYVNTMISSELVDMESILPRNFDYKKVSLSGFIIDKFSRFYGYSESALKDELRLNYDANSKHSASLLAKAILGVSLDDEVKIEEFEKANILVKTITLDSNGHLKESMSFAQINYEKILEEESFEDSYLYNEIVSKKFLLVIFRRKNEREKYLEKVMFWDMDATAVDFAYNFWSETKSKVKEGDFDNFWRSSDNRIFHVRPKARTANDTVTLSDGRRVKKLAYWVNRKYLFEKILN